MKTNSDRLLRTRMVDARVGLPVSATPPSETLAAGPLRGSGRGAGPRARFSRSIVRSRRDEGDDHVVDTYFCIAAFWGNTPAPEWPSPQTIRPSTT